MASPIVCELKRAKSVRLTCHFCYVDKYTVPNGFPIQNIDEVKLKVGNSNFISVFGAKSGYWQIKVREEDQWLPTYSIHDSLHEWTRVLFGMKNVRATVVGADQSWIKNEVIYVKYNDGINTVVWECIPLLYSGCYNYKAKLTDWLACSNTQSIDR